MAEMMINKTQAVAGMDALDRKVREIENTKKDGRFLGVTNLLGERNRGGRIDVAAYELKQLAELIYAYQPHLKYLNEETALRLFNSLNTKLAAWESQADALYEDADQRDLWREIHRVRKSLECLSNARNEAYWRPQVDRVRDDTNTRGKPNVGLELPK